MKKTKKIAVCGVMCALAFAFSYIEFLIPFDMIGIPGIKPGFANLVIMAALYMLGLPYAAVISFVRIVLSWLIFGSFTSFLYSLAGGVLSLFLMFLLKKFKVFDETGVSVSGAVMHNAAQLAVAALITSEAILYYMPVLIIAGVVFGVINGLLLKLVIKRTEKLFL